jgi:hypothetical protein
MMKNDLQNNSAIIERNLLQAISNHTAHIDYTKSTLFKDGNLVLVINDDKRCVEVRMKYDYYEKLVNKVKRHGTSTATF